MGIIINIFKLPELRRRVLFTLAMLAVYRFGVFVVLDPWLALGALVMYVQTIALTRTSALGSLTAVSFMALATVLAGRPEPYQLLALGIVHAHDLHGFDETPGIFNGCIGPDGRCSTADRPAASR